MKRTLTLKFTFIFTILLSSVSFNINANSAVFSKAVFEQIKQEYQGQQWLMLLWSVDCPPCFKELALVQHLVKDNPDIPIVIINADDNDEVDDARQQILASYQLGTLPNYYFGDDQGDKSRFIIDSNWYGELPRSYFVEKSGKFHGKSGLVSEKLLRQWLLPTEDIMSN